MGLKVASHRMIPGGPRPDPFTEVWPEVRAHLEVNPGLEAKTLFIHLG